MYLVTLYHCLLLTSTIPSDPLSNPHFRPNPELILKKHLGLDIKNMPFNLMLLQTEKM